MRFTENLALLLAAAGTQVVAQSLVTETTTETADVTTSAAPTGTGTPEGPETGELGDALVVTNNPVGVVYKATLPENAYWEPAYPEGGNIEGEVTAEASPDGRGVKFHLKLSNLPQGVDKLTYHLHVAPVPEDGNCTATLAHLDPFVRGEVPACDADAPETCQVGDLSGKYGAIPTEGGEFETTYTDLYASTLEGIGAFFGNRSIVFHYPNKTRVTCANFERVDGGATLPTGSTTTVPGAGPTAGVPVPTTSSPGAPTTSLPVPGGAAAARAGIAGAVVFAAAAMFLL